MPYCQRCHQEKRTAEMLRDKHEPGNHGYSRFCRECGKLPDMLRQIKNLRDRNAYAARRATDDAQRLAAVVAAGRAERQAVSAHMTTRCNRCQEIKTLDRFPISKHGPLMHSATCFDCWAADPDGKRELARERARDWSRAQAYKRPNDALRDQHDRDLYERYMARRAEDNQLRDYSAYGYTRREWKALGHERREEIRKAAILAGFGAEVVSDVGGAAAARDVDNEMDNEAEMAALLASMDDDAE